MIEIERKFLVLNHSFKTQAYAKNNIIQGYISTVPERTVRVRIKGDKGFLTIKGISSESGMSRYEWEKSIDYVEARQLLLLCEPGIINKTRYEISRGKYIFEVDVFHDENDGLLIAEIELKSENDTFPIPSWLGPEVTDDPRFYNAYISKNSFKNW